MPDLSPDAEDPDDDFVLMQRTARGDEEGFRQLVERHQGAVRGTIYRMLNGSQETDDLAQQVFLRVWKASSRYQPSAKFTTWLMTITRNVVFNETRRKGRASFLSFDAPEPGEEIRSLADPSSTRPDEEAGGQELSEAIDRALQELPEKQRLALILHRYEDMPHEEVAKVLGVTIPSVKSLIFRAREALRHKLARFLK